VGEQIDACDKVASNAAWRMTKTLDSIDRLMSGIRSRLSWMTEAAQSLFGTLIKMNDCNRPNLSEATN
jgi:hypothetical protein